MYLLYFENGNGVSEQVLQCNADTVEQAQRLATAYFGDEPGEGPQYNSAFSAGAYPHGSLHMAALYKRRQWLGYEAGVWVYSVSYKGAAGSLETHSGEVTAPDAVTAIARAHDDTGADMFDAHECEHFNLSVTRKRP